MSNRVALLDNAIQVDRVKSATRRDEIEGILSEYDWKVTTSICLLEFKATVIQECITIHGKLLSVGKYTPVVDRLTESTHRQAKLRGHILRNLINVFAPSSFDVTEEHDRRLAEKARLQLENVIPWLYKWFTKSVDTVLKDDIGCSRALEPPEKKRVAFAVNLPYCHRGKNKYFRVEDFIRTQGAAILEQLETAITNGGEDMSNQLSHSLELFKEVVNDKEFELSHSQCRRAGDYLIALEGREHATHFLSTNAKEWHTLSEILSREFVRVAYAAEKRI